MSKIAQLNHIQDSANRSKQFTLEQIAELSEATASDISILASAIGELASESDTTISGGGSISYSQVTKRNVTAPKEVDISLPYSNTFNYPPVEVLKFEAGQENIVVTACNFDNGDSDDFTFNSTFVIFDGYMHPYVNRTLSVTTPFAVGNYYLSTSEFIDITGFERVEKISVGNTNTLAMTMTATGGGKGTWALTLDMSEVILVAADGKAYDCNGTLLNNNWNALNDTQKVALFDNVSNSDAVAFASTLGSFQFAFLSTKSDAQLCNIVAIPSHQTVIPSGLISIAAYENIDNVTVTATTANNGDVRILVTTDRLTYYKYSNSWVEVDINDIATQGMTPAQLANINADAWSALNASQIGFAYSLYVASSDDVCNVDSITLTVDMQGTWKKAIHGTDYTYGYNANTNLNVKLLTDGSYKINYSY